jgi:hypothetical protein
MYLKEERTGVNVDKQDGNLEQTVSVVSLNRRMIIEELGEDEEAEDFAKSLKDYELIIISDAIIEKIKEQIDWDELWSEALAEGVRQVKLIRDNPDDFPMFPQPEEQK